jgi:hypothetical protein
MAARMQAAIANDQARTATWRAQFVSAMEVRQSEVRALATLAEAPGL